MISLRNKKIKKYNLNYERGDILKLKESYLKNKDYKDPEKWVKKRYVFLEYRMIFNTQKWVLCFRIKDIKTNYYTNYYYNHLELDKSLNRDKNIDKILI